MTVKELIAKLQELPENHKVVVSLHSEYAEAETVQLVEAFNNGGYYSRPYGPKDKAKAHGVVYIG